MIVELLLAFALGLGLGVVTGLPLGVVNVAVVATAARHGARAGSLIGLGGAFADATHATVAFAGLAPVIAAHSSIASALTVVSGVVLIVFAGLLARPRPPAEPADARAADRPQTALGRIAAGVALTLPNPAALAAWIAVATALDGPPSIAAAALTALGVGLGSALYFTGLARIAARSARTLRRPRWLDRGAALAIGAVGVVAIARAAARLI